MRSVRLAAAATAPLVLAAAAAPAAAQTTVSTATTTPLSTATAGDVTIAAGGSITFTSGAAVTVNSNNNFTSAGSISANNVSNATGVLLQGGNTGGVMINNGGTITVTTDFTASDSANGDGIVEAPFANGSNRYGIHLVGGPAFVGDIVHSAGTITVKGDGSYGILLEAPLTGNLTVNGPVTLTGDGGAGVRETAGVSGAIAIGGGVTTSGTGSSAVVLQGDVGGRVGIYSALTSSGYSSLTRPTTTLALQNVEKTAADLQQGGPALLIAGNMGSGVFLGGTNAAATTDLDGDGTPDNAEGTASITSYGSSAAVQIGMAGKAITLSNYDPTSALNSYGFVNHGSISGQGVYDGVTATGLQVGVAGGTVSLSGGLRNVGTITAGAYDADANAVHVLAGASVAHLVNELNIAGSIPASTGAVTARGVLIDAGASVPYLANSGTINGTAIGDKANVAAIVDNSGTLSSVNNSGTISTTLTGTLTGTVADATTGTRTALDLSHNTTGVMLTQSAPSGATPPAIIGDIFLGSGVNTVDFEAGSVTGALVLGGATGSTLTLGGSAVYTGALTYTGAGLGVAVNGAAVLSLTNARTTTLSSLNVGAGATVRFAVDAAHGTASTLNVSGAGATATLAAGAVIGLNVLSTTAQTQLLPLVTATNGATLSVGALSTASLSSLPFLVSASLVTTPSALEVSVTRRTAAQLGLTASEAPALDGVTNGVNASAGASAALLGQTTQAGFASTFRQLLPERGEGVIRFTEQAARQVGEATAEADDFADAGHAWVQQLVLGFRQDATPERERVQAGGYGAAGGLQSDQGPFGAIGATAMFAIGTTEDKDRPVAVHVDVTNLEGGLYWRARLGGLRLEARGGFGYLWLHGVRGIYDAATPTSAVFTSNSQNDRNGYDFSGRFGGSYQLDFGRFWIRPQANVEYFRLHQDGYAETGGGAGVDLTTAATTGEMTSGIGSVEFGARFGSPDAHVWKPSVEVGVRDVFQGDTGALTAGYGGLQAANSVFTLSPLNLKGTDALAKAKLSVAGRGYDFDFVASGEERSTYKEAELRAVARFSF